MTQYEASMTVMTQAPQPVRFDFTRSLPPVPPQLDAVLAQGLAWLAARPQAAAVRATAPSGRPADALAGAEWLVPRVPDVDPDRLLIANGTQSAVLLLIQSLVPPGKMLGAEALSYGMLRALAGLARAPVRGLDIDAEGVIPDALEAACASGALGALYLNPTFHNPTGAVMGLARREALLAIARTHALPIIEDDPLGLLYDDLPPALHALAPEQVWHVVGLTKTIAQGMRVAYIVAPNLRAHRALLRIAERLSHWVAAPLSLALATWLIESGQAIELRRWIAAENRWREAAAREALAGFHVEGARGSPHVWLPMTGSCEREVADALLVDGAQVRGEELFRVDDDAPALSGIRLSLSSLADRARLLDGLGHVRRRLEACDRRLGEQENRT